MDTTLRYKLPIIEIQPIFGEIPLSCQPTYTLLWRIHRNGTMYLKLMFDGNAEFLGTTELCDPTILCLKLKSYKEATDIIRHLLKNNYNPSSGEHINLIDIAYSTTQDFKPFLKH